MADSETLDPLVLGRRVRHFRSQAGLTLDALGALVDKPAPYLSLLENGRKEPKINLVLDIARALQVDIADLLAPSPPTRRDSLEISLIRAQETALFEALDVPAIKPSAKMDNQTWPTSSGCTTCSTSISRRTSRPPSASTGASATTLRPVGRGP